MMTEPDAGFTEATASQTEATLTEATPRFAQLDMARMTPAQRALAEEILGFSSVGISGPYNAFLRSPVMARRMIDLLDYLRWHSSLPARLTEFAILIQARLWRSQVEWFAHHPLALKAGLAPSVAADLKANRRPEGMQADEAAVYDFCMALSTGHAVPQDIFERTRDTLGGEQPVVDLTVLSGTYVSVAMILAVAEQGVPPGREAPFAPGEA
jgi:4-carboxymuconolactone decarboxylase